MRVSQTIISTVRMKMRFRNGVWVISHCRRRRRRRLRPQFNSLHVHFFQFLWKPKPLKSLISWGLLSLSLSLPQLSRASTMHCTPYVWKICSFWLAIHSFYRSKRLQLLCLTSRLNAQLSACIVKARPYSIHVEVHRIRDGGENRKTKKMHNTGTNRPLKCMAKGDFTGER